MELMLAGMLLFTGAHLTLGVAADKTTALRERFGGNAVKGLVALGSAVGITLIALGWRSSPPEFLYPPPRVLHGPALLLLCFAVYLFIVSGRPSALKRVIRHPQLTAVLLWSLGHLLLNGDSRSLLLFGGLGVWATCEILLINRREGTWIKSAAPGIGSELLTLAVAGVACALLVYLHPWLAGVPAIAAR